MNYPNHAYPETMILAVLLILLYIIIHVAIKSKCKATNGRNSWSSRCALYVIKQLGWKIHNITSTTLFDKAVVIMAPHTSNWDFIYGMLFMFSYPTLPIRFAIKKKEVMFFPLSYLMKALGAIPIDRSKKVSTKDSSMVAIMADMLNEADKLLVLIAPEGTRKYAKRWKTGFYRLSEATHLPIILGYINYATKEMGLGPAFYPTGHIENDVLAIQTFYRNIPGKHPEHGVK